MQQPTINIKESADWFKSASSAFQLVPLVQQYKAATDSRNQQRAEIERQVQKRTQDLEKSWLQHQQREQQRILEEERSRIMMEMHDGLGGQLVSILSQIDNETLTQVELKTSVQGALDDLRLMVDAMSPVDNDLPMALGMFRHRLEKTLAGSSMQLVWKVVDVDSSVDLGPNEVLNILRILQEAATNAVKHSDGDRLTIQTGHNQQGVFVSIADNGSGFDPDGSKGQGLANMQRRAQNAGIDLKMNTGGDGVSVVLNLADADTLTQPTGTQATARDVKESSLRQFVERLCGKLKYRIDDYRQAYFPGFNRMFF